MTRSSTIRLTVAVNPEFNEQNPEYSEFLAKYKTSSQMTSDALAYISDNDASYRDAAVWFLKSHDDLIDQWLPEDKAALVREGL